VIPVAAAGRRGPTRSSWQDQCPLSCGNVVQLQLCRNACLVRDEEGGRVLTMNRDRVRLTSKADIKDQAREGTTQARPRRQHLRWPGSDRTTIARCRLEKRKGRRFDPAPAHSVVVELPQRAPLLSKRPMGIDRHRHREVAVPTISRTMCGGTPRAAEFDPAALRPSLASNRFDRQSPIAICAGRECAPAAPTALAP